MAEGNLIRNYWSVIVVAAGVIASAAVAQSQIANNKDGIATLTEEVDENGKAIIELQRRADRREGEVALEVQKIQIEQQQQGEDLDEILQILKEGR